MKVKKELLDIVRDKIRFKHYSLSTEKSYLHWFDCGKKCVTLHNINTLIKFLIKR